MTLGRDTMSRVVLLFSKLPRTTQSENTASFWRSWTPYLLPDDECRRNCFEGRELGKPQLWKHEVNSDLPNSCMILRWIRWTSYWRVVIPKKMTQSNKIKCCTLGINTQFQAFSSRFFFTCRDGQWPLHKPHLIVVKQCDYLIAFCFYFYNKCDLWCCELNRLFFVLFFFHYQTKSRAHKKPKYSVCLWAQSNKIFSDCNMTLFL